MRKVAFPLIQCMAAISIQPSGDLNQRGNLCYHYMILILLIHFRCSPFILVPNISIILQFLNRLSQNLSQNCSVSETVLEVLYLRTCLRIVLSQNMSQNCSISEHVPELSNKLWIMKIRKLSSSLIL